MSSGIIVETPLGSYEQSMINPASKALVWDEAVVPAEGLGTFTVEQATDAQRWVATFVASEGIDSFAYNGTPEDARRWLDENRDSIDPAYATAGEATAPADRHIIVNTNAGDLNPTAIYDGGMRVTRSDLTLHAVQTYTEAGTEYLQIAGTASTDYRTPDEELIAALEASGGTREQIADLYPQLVDADADNSVFKLDWDFTYWLSPKEGGGWLISGYRSALHTPTPPVE